MTDPEDCAMRASTRTIALAWACGLLLAAGTAAAAGGRPDQLVTRRPHGKGSRRDP
jgi:hypothetical protein